MELPAVPSENHEDLPQPKWEPLNSIDRRVIGVLIEKAKTTPDAYPLTLNALCNGCNQKSNRSPVMQLEPEQVEESLDRLRQMGAVFVVQGGGRVEKFRHNMYEWLGVSKQEIAVMAELLLRGDQAQGELRARAARMEPIAGLTELRPILQGLKQRGLLVSLTSEGRGHVVTHSLYKPREMEKLLAKYAGAGYDEEPTPSAPPISTYGNSPSSTPAATTFSETSAASSRPAAMAITPAPVSTPGSSVANEVVDSLQRENETLNARVAELNSQVADLTDRVEQTERALRELRDSLGG